jgi:ribonuclease HI
LYVPNSSEIGRHVSEVSVAEFMARLNPRVPTFVETDGACAGNEKKSPGGWGAIACQERYYCQLFGSQEDTSNNEIECLATSKAMEMIPRQMYIVIETDWQMCIDSLTKFGKRWEKNGWRLDNGTEVANAAIVGPLARVIDER